MKTIKRMLKIIIGILIILLFTNLPKTFAAYPAKQDTKATYSIGNINGYTNIGKGIFAMGQSALGTDIQMGFSQSMLGTDYVYCIDQKTNNNMDSTGAKYTIYGYIEINDEKLTAYSLNNDGTITELPFYDMKEDPKGIAKQIRMFVAGISPNGPCELGYGYSVRNYKTAQKAVYTFWDSIVSSIEGGSPWKGGGNSSYASVANSLKEYQEGYSVSAKIYILRSNEKTKWQRLIIAEGNIKQQKVVVQKVWEDAGNTSGRTDVTVNILNKETNETQTVTLTASNNYKAEVPGIGEDLDKYEFSESEVAGYKLASIKVDKEKRTVTITNKKGLIIPDLPDIPIDWPGDNKGSGNVKISGTVYLSELTGKSNSVSSEKTDKGVEGVEVYWMGANGGVLACMKTDANGYYELKTPITIYQHPYKIDKAQYDNINGSYVVFKYDGYTYTTVALDANRQSINSTGSKAEENSEERQTVDNYFDTISKDGVFDQETGKMQPVNYTISGNEAKVDDEKLGQYSKLSASTKGKIGDLLKNYASTKRKLFCVEHCNRGNVEKSSEDGFTTSKYYKPHVTHTHTHTICTPAGCYSYSTSEYCNCGKHPKIHCVTKTNRIYEWEIPNVNLGLYKKEQPNIAITTDINEVRVEMKNQAYTYIYRHRGLDNIQPGSDYFKASYGNKYSETYKRPVNPADISYIAYHNSDEMNVYVKYDIRVSNLSNTLRVKVGKIIDYYQNENYDICSKDIIAMWNEPERYKTVVDWTPTSAGMTGYGAATTTALEGQILEPETVSDKISIVFSVKDATLRSLEQKQNVELTNIAEIDTYTTYYGDSTLCAEAKKGRYSGKQYSGIDYNSKPGDVPSFATGGLITSEIAKANFQDDTDFAPTFKLERQDNGYRILQGTVYEDKNTSNALERIGNGINDVERGVAGVKVELLEADTGQVAKMYYVNGGIPKASDAIVYTDANGNYSFGSQGIFGVIEDNYILKYTYGNDIIKQSSIINTYTQGVISGSAPASGITTIDGITSVNAKNYKSTIVTNPIIKALFTGVGEENWHLNKALLKNLSSIALDDIAERAIIDTSLKYSNFDETASISAYSKPFKLEVQFTKDQEQEVDKEGGTFEKNWDAFDFGIIERPRENIVLNKTISNIKVTLANGQILLDGDPYGEKINYLIALGSNENKYNRNENLVKMEMDTELIQGARLDVTYTVTVTNNSEYDENYFISTEYYNYGTKTGNILTDSVELVVDYLDPEFVYEFDDIEQDNKQWDLVKTDDLTGLISTDGDNSTTKYIEKGNYTILTTKYFENTPVCGGTKSLKLHVSKMLANKGDAHIYENHTEILQTDGRVARTIAKTHNGTQVVKTYKPGDYLPSVLGASSRQTVTQYAQEEGKHEQDDDSIIIRITPPTGTSISTILLYITTITIGLAIIIVGIIVIKKKVLKR